MPCWMAAEDEKGKPIQSHKCDFVNQTSIASEGLLVMMVIVFVMLDVAAQNGTHFSKHAMRVVPVQEDGCRGSIIATQGLCRDTLTRIWICRRAQALPDGKVALFLPSKEAQRGHSESAAYLILPRFKCAQVLEHLESSARPLEQTPRPIFM